MKKKLIGILVVANCAGCAPPSCPLPDAGVASDAAPSTAGLISSLEACQALDDLYALRVETSAFTCPAWPVCPWPASLPSGECPVELDGVCVPAACDPFATNRVLVAARAANTCEQFLAALASDPGACR